MTAADTVTGAPLSNMSRGELIRMGVFHNLFGLVKFLPSPIGDILRHAVLKLFGARMACSGVPWIRDGLTVYYPWRLSIGRDCCINEYCHFNAYGGIEIGNCVMMGHRTTIMSDDHVISNPDNPVSTQGRVGAKTVIEDDVLIGSNVFIGKGVRIGKGAVIGTASVITQDVEPYAIVVGNPARVIDYRKRPAHH